MSPVELEDLHPQQTLIRFQGSRFPLFANLVLLSNGILYLVGYVPPTDSSSESNHPTEEPTSAPEQSYSRATFRVAQVSVCINLAIALVCTIVLAALNRSVDRKGTLRVDNRWLRLAPRACAVVVFATIWMKGFEDPTVLFGYIALVLSVVTFAEYGMGMEKGGGLIEPKSAWGLASLSKSKSGGKEVGE